MRVGETPQELRRARRLLPVQSMKSESRMEKKLHWLESIPARGSDGATYKVMAYEHLLRIHVGADGHDHWEPAGLTEYRLASGERVDVGADGAMRVVPTGVE